MINPISIKDYTYDLPGDRIAEYPLADRDESKLLVYQKGEIRHTVFKSLHEFIPANAILYFNDTRVIPARLFFTKQTGAVIEILLLNPTQPSSLLMEVMKATGECSWQCTIGNLKRWKENTMLCKQAGEITLTAELVDRKEGIVRFTWIPEATPFAEVVLKYGVTPLPPYIKREASDKDVQRYQTIYAHYEGAVAAPTAGLHFTNNVLHTFQVKGVRKDFLTLHVSAGTFQPVKTENALEHVMHQEQIVITRKNLENLLRDDRLVISVGTTSMRTLESIYWYGVKLLNDPDAGFNISQSDPYVGRGLLPRKNEALEAVLRRMTKTNSDILTGYTSIYIYPGYTFRICEGLITNFHLPGSTLMLLVAAFIGNQWKKIYSEALKNQYRFLSYGDSSLLLP